jgi:predicted  nucleic acid-binding Zn ribbon protein
MADEAYTLLAHWLKNGQIVGSDWQFVTAKTTLDVYVTIPEESALDPAHDNLHATELRAQRGPAMPEVTVLGPDPTQPPACACGTSSALVLYTHFLTFLPPVRCLACLRAVPLYRLPHTHEHEHLNILSWAADYRACDTLQTNSVTGERFGAQQMSRHDSSLSANGRDIARKLETATGRPTYYYLHPTGRPQRKCPSCLASWSATESGHLFVLRCDRCRLLSNHAS